MHRIVATLLGLAILVSAAPGAANQALADVERARDAHAFARTVMSPFCPGRTLTDCPSPDAAALREEIRQQLAAGVSEEAIRLELERRFGTAVVAVPRSVWAWIIPLSILGAGLVGLIAAFRALSARDRTGASEPAPASPELARDLDADLDRRGL
jgi:cytochrome c-type biogenesis protein CcmH